MSTRKFIKIGNCLLNTNSIMRVWINPKEFQIELSPTGTTGFMILGSGQFSAESDKIVVNKEKYPESYNYVENWIQEIDSE